MLKVGCCLPPLLKFLVATASIYEKILWFVFDLIYVILWFLLAVNSFPN